MQLEAPQVKSSDNVQAKNQAESLSVQNQVIEGAKPGDTKAATATATAQLETKGDLPKVAIFDSANSATNLAAITAKSQPEAQTANTNPTGKVTAPAESALTSNDLTALNSSIGALKADETALSKAPTSAQDLTKVNDDEQTLRTNELAYMHASAASTTFAAYSASMAADKPELTNIATGLWKMGQKTDASQTTSYFPSTNYEKYFSNSTGTGTTPGDPTLKNETSYTNLQDDTWKKNLIAGQIGGTGINPDMQLSTSGNKMTATMSGGGYTDGLISNTQKLNTSDNTVQMNYNVNIKPGSDLHCLESDIAITTGKQPDGKVLTAMAASQFVMDPKTGEMSFDTSGTNHQWVDAINDIPMPKDGTNMDVSMTVKMVGNQYEYTGLDVDGKSYAFNNPADSTFTMTQLGPKGWTPNTIHTQLQQDLGASGGSSTVTYNDVQVNQGNS